MIAGGNHSIISNERLPYSDFSTFPKQYDKHHFPGLLSQVDQH